MDCSTCGAQNKPGRRFCVECGAALGAACPSCGSAVEAGERFCGECGTPLQGGDAQRLTPAIVPVPPTPVAERRLVSVLFADLVGFTPFAEERDAEEVRETLTRYFELASEVIVRYGGTVEKFIGDAVMAVWGAPVAREDDAERAVRAGLELVDAVRSLGPGIQARAGVLTGEAAVTLGATNQGMVAGDLVNTASRLQGVAPPGTVLVGEATHRSASSAIAFEPAGEQLLKGKTAPVPAWRALRVVAEVGGRNRSEGLEAPFVGRDEEFRLLKDLFHATSRERRVRLVSVIGPAGIGKSRLAWEFLKYIDGLVDTVWWHSGRSPAYGRGISFWALGEMVRGRCGLAETDDEASTRASVGAKVRELIPDEAERRWVEPALLALLGIGSDIGAEQLFGAWRTFFERLAASAPVVMVFEDLHFADAGMLDFIDHLLEWSKGLPIYIVTLARPELLENRPDWGAGKRNFVALSLEPLPESAVRALLAGLVPGLPEPAVRVIVARADGIPLYAVETVRMLVAEGRLREESGAYVPVGDLTSLAVPETLTALIAARLDALEPADRALVQDAAVLGQSFTVAGLAAVSGLEPAALESRLRGLVRRELLTLAADQRSADRGQYAFVQALIREVAYNTLARRDRKTRHLAAARYFEALGSDELAGALAGQYLAAHENATEGAEADALASQARIALRAAAERAVSLGSYAQAIAFLEQALTVTSDPAEEAELLERAGDAADIAARRDEAISLLRSAIERHRARGDREGVVRATATLGRILNNTARSAQAQEVLEAAAAAFADLDEAAMVGLQAQLARAMYLNEKPIPALAIADQALAVAERHDLLGIIADLLVSKGSILNNIGRGYEGHGVLEAGLQLAISGDLPQTAFRARNNLGAHLASRDPRAALAILRAGLDEARRLGLLGWVLNLAGNAIAAAEAPGEWRWVDEELANLMAMDLDSEDRASVLSSFIAFAAYRGRPCAAELAEFDRLLAGSTDPGVLAALYSTRAAVAFSEHRLEDAWRDGMAMLEVSALNVPAIGGVLARIGLWQRDQARVLSALKLIETSGAHGPAITVRIETIRAGLAALEGRRTEALALYRDAIRAWRDAGLPFEAALAVVDMASLLDPQEPDVRTAADVAREIFADLEAAPFQAQLEAALSRETSPARPAHLVDPARPTPTPR